MAPPQQPVLHQQLQSHTQPALSVAVPGDNALVASFQQTSPEFGSSFVSLVDVGTATMRLSNAYTQTEVNLHPNCPRIPPMQMQAHQHQQQQSEFTLLYHMTRDSCIGTSPPDAVAHMSVGNSPPECKLLLHCTGLLLCLPKLCPYIKTTSYESPPYFNAPADRMYCSAGV